MDLPSTTSDASLLVTVTACVRLGIEAIKAPGGRNHRTRDRSGLHREIHHGCSVGVGLCRYYDGRRDGESVGNVREATGTGCFWIYNSSMEAGDKRLEKSHRALGENVFDLRSQWGPSRRESV